jgi:hypothetical protein
MQDNGSDHDTPCDATVETVSCDACPYRSYIKKVPSLTCGQLAEGAVGGEMATGSS